MSEYDRITDEIEKYANHIEVLKVKIADLEVDRLRCIRRHPLDFDRHPSNGEGNPDA